MAFVCDKKKASELSAMWKKAVPIQSNFSNVPEGDYVADLKEMSLETSKKGRLQVVMTFEVVMASEHGDYTGQTCKRFDGIEEETGMGYFKNLCEVIGLDLPDNILLWQEAMNTFIEQNVTDLYDLHLQQQKDSQYINVYLNKISEYTKGEGEVTEETTEETPEEEVVEEVVEEETVEEVVEEPQQIVTPVKKKPVAAPIKKAASVSVPAKKGVTPTAQPVRKVVSLKR